MKNDHLRKEGGVEKNGGKRKKGIEGKVSSVDRLSSLSNYTFIKPNETPSHFAVPNNYFPSDKE